MSQPVGQSERLKQQIEQLEQPQPNDPNGHQDKNHKNQESQPINQQFVQSNIERAEQLKAQGNNLFKEQHYLDAIRKYQEALTYSDKSQHKLRSVLYSNIAICLAKELNFKDALSYCKKAVQNDPTYLKAQLNLALYYQKTESLDEALAQNKKLLQFYPKDVKILLKISELQKAIEAKTEQQKKEVIDGLKNIGNSVLGYFGLSLDNFKLEQGANGGYNISFKQ